MHFKHVEQYQHRAPKSTHHTMFGLQICFCMSDFINNPCLFCLGVYFSCIAEGVYRVLSVYFPCASCTVKFVVYFPCAPCTFRVLSVYFPFFFVSVYFPCTFRVFVCLGNLARQGCTG